MELLRHPASHREPGLRTRRGREPSSVATSRSTGQGQLDEKWTGVKTGQIVFESLARQTGYGKAGLQRLLNGLPPAG